MFCRAQGLVLMPGCWRKCYSCYSNTHTLCIHVQVHYFADCKTLTLCENDGVSFIWTVKRTFVGLWSPSEEHWRRFEGVEWLRCGGQNEQNGGYQSQLILKLTLNFIAINSDVFAFQNSIKLSLYALFLSKGTTTTSIIIIIIFILVIIVKADVLSVSFSRRVCKKFSRLLLEK